MEASQIKVCHQPNPTDRIHHPDQRCFNNTKNKTLSRLFLLAMCIAGQALASAANTTNTSAVTAEVFSIRETRGPNGRCDINLKFKGKILGDYSSVLGIRLVHAMDDAGADLCPTNGSGDGGWSSSGNIGFTPLRGWHRERPDQTRYGSVTLRASSRAARTIRDLQGELELFSPTFENGGVVVVEDFRAHPGSELPSPALSKSGIQLVYHTKQSFEAARKPASPKKSTEPSANFQTENDTGNVFPVNPQSSPDNYVVLQVSDPERKLAGFAFCGADGRFLPVGNNRQVNHLRVFSFVLAVLPEKMDLHVYLATSRAVKQVPFKLENIPLP